MRNRRKPTSPKLYGPGEKLGDRKADDSGSDDLVRELDALRENPAELHRQLIGMGITESGDEPTDAELREADVVSD